MSVFERIGGQQAVNLITDKFFDYLIADPNLTIIFKNNDIKNRRQNYRKFMSLMFGADDNSFGNITTISGKLGIQQSQFERTWTNLKASLEYYRVRSQLISEVKQIFNSNLDEIVQNE